MEISFDDHKLGDQDIISPDLAKQDITIDLNNDRHTHTLIIVDESAPYPGDPYKSPYLHYLVVNIPGDKLKDGTGLIDYIPPNPPEDDTGSIPIHEYNIYLFTQSKQIRPKAHRRRENFDVEKFVKEFDLTIEEIFTFGVGDKVPTPRSVEPGYGAVTQEGHFKPNSGLTSKQKDFCTCVLHVAAKQPGSCNFERAFFQERDERECYSPYAVCANSVGTTYRWCAEAFDLDNLSRDELLSMANLKQLTFNDDITHDELVDLIKSHIRVTKRR
jgi:phosphatidylethanolamine-binding protein (PEBP) family uncharacterized protein